MLAGTTGINIQVILTELDYQTIQGVHREVVDIISSKFMEENFEQIKRDILDNPKFADALYNAIVLKKAANFEKDHG